MRTAVLVTCGPLKNRRGWISGNLEDRAARGVTKALVHAGDDVELIAIAAISIDGQLELDLERNCVGTSRVRASAKEGDHDG